MSSDTGKMTPARPFCPGGVQVRLVGLPQRLTTWGEERAALQRGQGRPAPGVPEHLSTPSTRGVALWTLQEKVGPLM